MGWLQFVGSLKLEVSFAEYCLCCKALLQKRPVILRNLLIEATLYHHVQPNQIAHRAAQNFEIISKTLSAYQNSAYGIHDQY